MTSTYTYSLSTDFSGNLKPEQLKGDVNTDAGITPDCLAVENRLDVVNVIFDSALSGAEQTTLDIIVTNYVYTPGLPSSISTVCKTIVSNDPDQPGDFTSIAAAFAAGSKSVWVRNSTYIETADIVIPDRGKLSGEANGQVIIVFNGAYSIKADGSGGTKETTGTISFTQDSTAVVGSGTTFTNLSAGQFILIGNNFHTIDSVTDNTNLVLTETYRGRTMSNQSYIAQAMLTGVTIENIIVSSSSTTGIYLRAVRHSTLKTLAVDSCVPNIQVIDSGDSSLYTIISSNGTGTGITIDTSYDLLCDTLNIYNNTSHGLTLSGTSHSIVLDTCSCTCNGVHGFNMTDTGTNVSLTDCVAKQNASKGVNSDINLDLVIMESCMITNNGSDGIDFDGSSNIVSNCIVSNNNGHGIQAGSQGVIQGNQCTNNTQNGIDISGDSDCAVHGNRCVSNGADGIRCTGNHNILSSNRCTTNTGNGMEITSSANNVVVTSNVLSGNTGTNFVDNGIGTVTAVNIFN